MTPNERWLYEEEAHKLKGEGRCGPETKYTSQGRSYAEIERENLESMEQVTKMNSEIENTVRQLDSCSCELNV
jgi:hypothetical protein